MLYQLIANLFSTGWDFLSSTSQPLISFNAFHSLLVKFLPCWHKDSSNNKSFPAAELSIKPTLTESAPYSSISLIASGELPSCLDIFLRSLSLTIPVKYTLENGFSFLNSYPEIIILATQKNMISGPVTKACVG